MNLLKIGDLGGSLQRMMAEWHCGRRRPVMRDQTMRRTTGDIVAILPHLGAILFVFGIVLCIPVLFVIIGPRAGDVRPGALPEVDPLVFFVPGGFAIIVGIALRNLPRLPGASLSPRQAMLLCTASWLTISAVGAIPICFGTALGYLDSCFEAMSGLTTTGITMFSAGLDVLPRSVLFWRALIQWIGGLGILAMFLVVALTTGIAHQLYGAESHKVASKRPRPGLASTLKIFWAIYTRISQIDCQICG